MNIMTIARDTSAASDYAAVKQRQQATSAASDYAVIGTTPHVPSASCALRVAVFGACGVVLLAA